MREVDLGSEFKNPILFADYSDPDVIRVDDTFYMTASSFNYTPGLPILISKDLVNWKLAGYALENIGQERYSVPRHSQGVWAPAIRFHDGMFYIYYGMPDEGYYVVRTRDPLGKWEEPVCVLEGKGLIDPCPFWDEDGKAYIVHGYAKSRIGFKSILGIFEMSADGLKAISEDHFIFDGNDPNHPAVTIEGPKVYKRNGYYYIWAPAGGVREGYQVVLRSKSIRGPYEIKTVMHQGSTVINGPHQGGLVDTTNGDEWFIHFQDRGLYGRICHLQPVSWRDDWPVVGVNPDENGCAEPVFMMTKPDCQVKINSQYSSYFPYFGECDIYKLQQPLSNGKLGLTASDKFPDGKYGLQWQWLGDHNSSFCGTVTDSEGRVEDGLRLFCRNPSRDEEPTIWRSANVLTQKLIYPVFEAQVQMDASALEPGERAGVCMTGGQYVAAFVERDEHGVFYVTTIHSEGGDSTKTEVKELSEQISVYAQEHNLSIEEALNSIRWIMRFDIENGNESHEDLYFQNVKNSQNISDVRLRIYLTFDADHSGDTKKETEAMTDLGIDYMPSDHTWVGAKLGIFALRAKPKDQEQNGYADFKNFIVKEL